MAEYYIDTAGGPRGPYPAEKIIEGVRSGKIPTGARIRDAATNEAKRAVDLTSEQAGEYTPPSDYRAQGQHRNQYQPQRQVPRAQSAQQYPQQQYPQYQQPYPQQYPQQYPPQQGYGGQYQQPYGNQQPYGQQYPYPVAQQTSGMAIASLIISCTSLVICGPIAIVGIILGVLALKECEPHGTKKGRGLALAGIWVGVAITVLTVALFALIFAVEEM